MSFRPDPDTLRWAAGQVRASGPHVPDTTPLRCAYDHVRRAAQRLEDHADRLEAGRAPSARDEMARILDEIDDAACDLGDRFIYRRAIEAREILDRL